MLSDCKVAEMNCLLDRYQGQHLASKKVQSALVYEGAEVKITQLPGEPKGL